MTNVGNLFARKAHPSEGFLILLAALRSGGDKEDYHEDGVSTRLLAGVFIEGT